MQRKPFFLKEWRDIRGLNQAELGEKIGVEGPTISRWETGAMNWTGERIYALADALGIEPDELFRDPSLPEARTVRTMRAMAPALQEQAARVVEALGSQDKAA
jgi:transcriptional regulator with XRE-family HTH domain